MRKYQVLRSDSKSKVVTAESYEEAAQKSVPKNTKLVEVPSANGASLIITGSRKTKFFKAVQKSKTPSRKSVSNKKIEFRPGYHEWVLWINDKDVYSTGIDSLTDEPLVLGPDILGFAELVKADIAEKIKEGGTFSNITKADLDKSEKVVFVALYRHFYGTMSKESVRAEAQEFQTVSADLSLDYESLVYYQNYFAEQGKKYGLLREFHENGIC